MLYEYVATYGDKYRIDSFRGYRELRKDHLELLSGKVYYNSENSLRIETMLLYEVGQFVSIGGYPYGGRKFRLLELSFHQIVQIVQSFQSVLIMTQSYI